MNFEPFQRQILQSIRFFPKRRMSDAAFSALALRTYERQRRLNPVYRSFCDTSGTPARLSDWTRIPALPVSAFKAASVTCLPGSRARLVFRTSGTTRGSRRGEHRFRTSDFYDAAIDSLFAAYVLRGIQTARVASLVPPARERRDSSLSYMAARVMRRFATARFEAAQGNRMNPEGLARRLKDWARGAEPVLIFATTLALGAFLEFLLKNDVVLRLPRGSRIMETGGFKGKTTSVTREACVRLAARHLAVEPALIVNEYGMTELSSQFYDLPPVRGARRAGSAKAVPPWTRILVIDPASGRPCRAGQKGLLRILDLANQDSCAMIQTEDEGRIVPGGFELTGRKPGADLRGCSLTFEELEALA